ncbi:hypothetical protein LTR05_005518 [Lithohypha guttulata]|uniref:Gfo/Idh/MocA-like oxidoreductase N-terminal domain-containing protein n=1 Tax=Lithohypha guttulata TaxID=1690604 RepID=A0AAN7SYA9_9EURO|nr:hypothetical protein LTR05_005518 [Lithohypha guttulata]
MASQPPAVLMVGTGEYTTGYVASTGAASTSDKKIGVVGLTMFDLRRRGKVGDLSMVGVSGKKYPAIREHLQKNIQNVYNNLDVTFSSFPSDDKTDPDAYKAAIEALPKATKLLKEHLHLLEEAEKHNVLLYVEHHKRYDPAYTDAKFRSKHLGDFNYWYSYMSQPKSQLKTFASWAGKESDISYYLNSHHIDICEWMVREHGWVPRLVRASGSTGISESLGCQAGTEDTITLMADWENEKPEHKGKRATGVYTASWTAPQNAGVHSQQHFHYIASNGEISVNQAKRGYDVVADNYPEETAEANTGVKWYNPFYMRYAPDEEGNFAGQAGYGYISFEKFVDYAKKINDGSITLEEIDRRGLPTGRNTVLTTAILEAGRKSLDEGGRSIEIVVKGDTVELK